MYDSINFVNYFNLIAFPYIIYFLAVHPIILHFQNMNVASAEVVHDVRIYMSLLQCQVNLPEGMENPFQVIQQT